MNNETIKATEGVFGGSDPSILGYAEAASLLGTKIATLYCWVHQKRIPHIRIGRRCIRFEKNTLIQWLASRSVPVGVEVEE